MEDQYDHSINGQELRQQDIDSVSANAALADDRVLWEFIKTMPGSASPDKAIIPFATRNWSKLSGASSTALVWGNTADAKVHVGPFRAVIGSTTVVGTSVIEHMRGQRSQYLLGSTSLYHQSIVIAANASGNPRWTLVYANVTPDANGDTANVLKKDPTTDVVGLTGVITLNKRTTVTITTIDGTPGASPNRPTIPVDSGGTYRIPLAYVYVPDGFGAASTMLREYIHEVAPCAILHSTMGGVNLAPANHQHKEDGTVDTRQAGETPTGSLFKPGAYLPSTMIGGERRIIMLQLGLATISHQSGDEVDDSIDWRFRYFEWRAYIKASTAATGAFASDRAGSGLSLLGVASQNSGQDGVRNTYGIGQSFVSDIASPTAGSGAVMIDDTAVTTLGAGSRIDIYVQASDGKLIFKQTGTPAAQVIIFLDATAPYSNYGTV